DHAPGHVVFSPDSSTVATTLDGAPARPFNGYGVNLIPVERNVIHRFSVSFRELTHLAYSPDGAHLAVGCFDRNLSIYDVSSRAPLSVSAVRRSITSPSRPTASPSPPATRRAWSSCGT